VKTSLGPWILDLMSSNLKHTSRLFPFIGTCMTSQPSNDWFSVEVASQWHSFLSKAI